MSRELFAHYAKKEGLSIISKRKSIGNQTVHLSIALRFLEHVRLESLARYRTEPEAF